MKIDNLVSEKAILQEVGARLARYRLNRNMTQQALAKESGVSIATLKRMELGEAAPNIINLIRVLRTLRLLENLDLLLPPEPMSPVQQVLTHKNVRKRASSRQTKPTLDTPWTWEE